MTPRRSFLIAGVLVLLIWAPARPALAAPITFNTALPVPEGQGIFRLQLKYLRSTDDPGPAGRELGVVALPLVVAYGVTQRLALFGIVPVLDKRLDLTTPLGRRTRSVSGVGDATLLARYTLFQRDEPGRTTRFAPFVGVEAPTGDDDESDALGRLPQPLQLGSGSWDVAVGATATWQTLSREVDASFSYKLNREANDFELGDEARLDLSYQHRLWPRELGEGVPSFLYGVLESNLIRRDHNEGSGSADPDSGGTTWFLAPGIQYVGKRLVIEASAVRSGLKDGLRRPSLRAQVQCHAQRSRAYIPVEAMRHDPSRRTLFLVLPSSLDRRPTSPTRCARQEAGAVGNWRTSPAS